MDDDSRSDVLRAVWRALDGDQMGVTVAWCNLPPEDVAEAREALALAHKLAGNLTPDYPLPAGTRPKELTP